MQKHPSWRLASLALTSALISGCGFVSFLRSYTNVNGAANTISEEHAYPTGSFMAYALSGPTNAVREVNLAAELARLSGHTSLGCTTDWSATSFQDAGSCLDRAVEDFHEFSERDKSQAAIARNELQERLIMASNSACREFTQHLNTMQSSSNFLFGTLATGAGAAAAIVSSAVAAKALGGSAGAISGTRAELNADYFYNQAAPVVTRSIDDRRRTFLAALRGYQVPSGMTPLSESANATKSGGTSKGSPAKMETAGTPAPVESAASLDEQGELGFQTLPPHGFQGLDIDRYSIEAAIADAIYYNDLCSLDKGLENITTALVIAKHPGLDELIAAQDSENQLLQKELDGEKIRKEMAQTESETRSTQLAESTVSIARPDPFPPIRVGNTSGTESILVTNRSSSAVTFGSPIFENGEEFIKGSTDTCSGQSMAAGAACQIMVQFKPKKTGIRRGYILIIVNPDPRSPHKVLLAGTGV